MKPFVALVVLFALLGCEKKVLSESDEAINFAISWFDENALGGEFPSLSWKISENAGQFGNGWDCKYVFLRYSSEGPLSLQSVLDKENWGEWEAWPNKSGGKDIHLKCPFSRKRVWSVVVGKDKTGFKISDVRSLVSTADHSLNLQDPSPPPEGPFLPVGNPWTNSLTSEKRKNSK
ncbi:MAG: hypothetical protein AAF514_12605 [Verrucomicrobiota bacterium]